MKPEKKLEQFMRSSSSSSSSDHSSSNSNKNTNKNMKDIELYGNMSLIGIDSFSANFGASYSPLLK